MKSILKGGVIVFALVLAGWCGIAIMQRLMMRTDSRPGEGTLRMVKDVQIAVNNWITEYDELPLLHGEVLKEDVEIEVKGDFLAALLGEPVAGNIRGIHFLNVMPAKPKRPGVVKDEGGMRLVDQWGCTLRVALNGDGDRKLANPDVKNSDEEIRTTAPEKMRTRVMVFSAGKDGVFFTGDDLVSWR